LKQFTHFPPWNWSLKKKRKEKKKTLLYISFDSVTVYWIISREWSKLYNLHTYSILIHFISNNRKHVSFSHCKKKWITHWLPQLQPTEQHLLDFKIRIILPVLAFQQLSPLPWGVVWTNSISVTNKRWTLRIIFGVFIMLQPIRREIKPLKNRKTHYGLWIYSSGIWLVFFCNTINIPQIIP